MKKWMTSLISRQASCPTPNQAGDVDGSEPASPMHLSCTSWRWDFDRDPGPGRPWSDRHVSRKRLAFSRIHTPCRARTVPTMQTPFFPNHPIQAQSPHGHHIRDEDAADGFRPALYCTVLYCPVLSCPVLSCPVLSCPVCTYRTVSY
jgi:hypothetical protein